MYMKHIEEDTPIAVQTSAQTQAARGQAERQKCCGCERDQIEHKAEIPRDTP
jgi:hypothetical protein